MLAQKVTRSYRRIVINAVAALAAVLALTMVMPFNAADLAEHRALSMIFITGLGVALTAGVVAFGREQSGASAGIDRSKDVTGAELPAH